MGAAAARRWEFGRSLRGKFKFVQVSTIFREYDIRGVADKELLDADIEDLGRAIGTYPDGGPAGASRWDTTRG
jgi:hypothetical protein